MENNSDKIISKMDCLGLEASCVVWPFYGNILSDANKRILGKSVIGRTGQGRGNYGLDVFLPLVFLKAKDVFIGSI